MGYYRDTMQDLVYGVNSGLMEPSQAFTAGMSLNAQRAAAMAQRRQAQREAALELGGGEELMGDIGGLIQEESQQGTSLGALRDLIRTEALGAGVSPTKRFMRQPQILGALRSLYPGTGPHAEASSYVSFDDDDRSATFDLAKQAAESGVPRDQARDQIRNMIAQTYGPGGLMSFKSVIDQIVDQGWAAGAGMAGGGGGTVY